MKAFALALLLVALLAPSALAQTLPSMNPCGPLTIPSQPTTPAPVPSGGQATIVVEVAVGGELAATVTVTSEMSAPGWTLVSSPAPASIAAKASGQFSFIFAAGPEASGPANVHFAASGVCDAGGVPCPSSACVPGSVNADVVIPFQADEGFRFPGLDNLNVRPEYLIAGIILIGLATAIPFALRKKPTGILADCPEPLKMVKPGRGTSFPIELSNGSKDAAVAQFEVGAVPEGWSAFMPLPEVQLAGRESRSLWLMVRSPATASEGDVVDVELRLKDARGHLRIVKVRAEVQAA